MKLAGLARQQSFLRDRKMAADLMDSEMRVSIKSASNRDIYRDIKMIQESFGDTRYEYNHE